MREFRSSLERAFCEWLSSEGLLFSATPEMRKAFCAGVEWRSEELAIQAADDVLHRVSGSIASQREIGEL